MQRIMYLLLLCLALCGCGKSSPKAEVITADDLVGLEDRLGSRIDTEAQERRDGMDQCQEFLEQKIGSLRGEFEAHRNETNAVLRPAGKDPITTDLLQEMAESMAERKKAKLAMLTGGSSSQQLAAYSPQPSVPPSPSYSGHVPDPPKEDPVTNGRYEVVPEGPRCVAIRDTQTGWCYQWRQEGAGWRLVLWQKNYCGKCRCVHPM